MGAQVVKVSYIIIVDKSKGGPGPAETPDNGTGSSVNEVDGANVIPSNEIVTGRRYRDGVDVAASEFSTQSASTRLLYHIQVVEWINLKTGLIYRYVVEREPFEFHFPAVEVQNLDYCFAYRPGPYLGWVRGVVYPRWLEDCSPFTNDLEVMAVEQYPVVHVLELVDEAITIV